MASNGAPPASSPPSSSSGSVRLGLSGLLTTVRTVKYEHLLAGISGGVVSTLVLHPLDLLKIRFAVNDGGLLDNKQRRPQYSNLRHAFSSICKQEGVRGLYKGVAPNVTGAGTAWGFYFLFYSTIKSDMQDGNPKMQLSPGRHMLAASQAGILTLAMTNPIWVVKTRLCLQYDTGNKLDPSKTYKGMADALYKIAKYEGIKGLYKGFVPGLWGVSHGAIQFMAYEELKSEYNHFCNQPIDTKLGTTEYLFFAALSKLFAAVTTYPYQVVRARLQDCHSHYGGAVACVKHTFRNEGFSGFYKGLTPNLMRVVPATAITFVVYEQVSHYLAGLKYGHG